MKPKLIVLASGTKDDGGSGFENLVNASRTGILDAEIVAVVSNHEHGGVRERADRLGVPFVYFPGPFDAEHYSSILQNTRIDWAALSGWLKKVQGLDPQKTFNIHPALLSQLNGRFGGANMYGHRVHEAVAEALEKGEITESGCSMHFVTEEYDRGPVFFEFRVPLNKGMNADEIAKAVNAAEHEWQPKITNTVVHEEIRWDGKNPENLITPKGYKYLPRK
ncbi:MAG: formyltransferase family protein [bacterium]|nr:formyltransferase family protein [bacterium]